MTNAPANSEKGFSYGWENPLLLQADSTGRKTGWKLWQRRKYPDKGKMISLLLLTGDCLIFYKEEKQEFYQPGKFFWEAKVFAPSLI